MPSGGLHPEALEIALGRKDVFNQCVKIVNLEKEVKREERGNMSQIQIKSWMQNRGCKMSIIFAFLALIMIFAKTKFCSNPPISKYLSDQNFYILMLVYYKYLMIFNMNIILVCF